MKTKRTIKIVTLTLTALLLFCAIVGITVSAAGTGATEVKIAGKNISYEGAPQILYYVQADGLADGQTVKVEIKHGDDEAYVKEVATDAEGNKMTATINGTTYYIVYSKGIAPKDMTKTVTAKAYIENTDGTKVEAAESVEYSIYTYAMNRFSASPTADQVTLYTALLDYGAAVQEVFSQTDDTVAADIDKYGWADAYYDVTSNIYVDGELRSDLVTTTKGVRVGSIDNINNNGDFVIAYTNSSVDDAIYKTATASDGKNLTSLYTTPGTHSYNLYYTTDGIMNDFEGLTDVNVLFENQKYVRYTNGFLYCYTLKKDAINLTDADNASVYMAFENGVGKNGSASDYITTGTAASTGGGWKIDIGNDKFSNYGVGTKYIVDFDFQIAQLTFEKAADERIVFFGLNGSVEGYNNAAGNSGKNFTSSDIYAKAGESAICIGSATSTAKLSVGEWYDVRIEYDIYKLDDVTTTTNEGRATVSIYIDGELAWTNIVSSVGTPESLYMEMRSVTGGQKYYIDNLYSNAFVYEDTKGNGKYYNGMASATSNVIYDFDDVESLDTVSNGGIVSYTNKVTLNDMSAANYLAADDGELVAGTNGTYNKTWGIWRLKGPDNSENDAEVGTKYVLEMDFKYAQGTGRDGSADSNADGRLAYGFGICSSSSTSNRNSNLFNYEFYDANGAMAFSKTPEFTLTQGEWYNLLFEYEIVANGFSVSGSTAYHGKLNVYINGELAVSKTCSSSSANSIFDSIYFEHNGTDAKYMFDNVYMGIIPNSGTKGQGVYYNKAQNGEITGATVYDFTDDTTIEVGDELKSTNYASTVLNNYTTGGVVVTNTGSMKIGDTSGWKWIVINANDINLEIGEQAVFETDFCFLGSDAQSDYIAEFDIRNGAGTDINDIRLYNGSLTGSSCTFNKKSTLNKNVWYNICIIVTRTETGATIDYYVDGTKCATDTTTKDASVIGGLYFVVRTSGATNQSYLFDNIVFDNISVNEAE